VRALDEINGHLQDIWLVIPPQFVKRMDRTLPPTLYHYTSPAGLLGIVESRSFWLTDCAYLNDSSELTHADSVLVKVVDEKTQEGLTPVAEAYLGAIKRRLEEGVFLTSLTGSFSENGDLLSQWRAYCPVNGGYSIGFRSNFIETTIGGFSYTLRSCIYESGTQEQLIRKHLDLALLQDSEDHVFQNFELFYRFLRPRMKHDSFSEEREWRLLSVDPLETIQGLRFRPGASFLIPYVPITFVDNQLPIQEIIVGPCKHPDLAAMALRRMLDTQGQSHISVRLSGATWRAG
jgi:hypothetical protein